MIKLRRLRAESFKGLRSVDLTFPEQGSIFIEGHNEAGKSTLFEAVYVALYGEALVGEEGRARLEEIVQHGQPRAVVELAFMVGVQQLTVRRTFERDRQPLQRATLTVQRPGMKPETISRIRAINARILLELGNLDGDSLRNSCFVEQKELGRLESMSLADRERAVQKLLGLERLTDLAGEFKFKREQERELHLAERHRDLARAQAEALAAAAEEETLAERLDAVRITGHLAVVEHLRDQEARTTYHLMACKKKEQEIRERLARCERIRELLADCEQSKEHLVEARRAREAVDQISQEQAGLDRLENEELPSTRAHLVEVCEALKAVTEVELAAGAVHAAEEDVREAQQALEELERAEADLHRLERELNEAQSRAAQRRQDAAAGQERSMQRLRELDARAARLRRTLERVTEWEAASEALRLIEEEIGEAKNKERQLAALRSELQEREVEAQRARVAAADAGHDAQIAAERERHAAARDALVDWIRLKHAEAAITGYAGRRTALESEHLAAATAHAGAQAKGRRSLFAALGVTALTLIALLIGLAWRPALAVAAMLWVGCAAAWVLFFRTRGRAASSATSLAALNARLREVEVEYEATVRASGDPAELAQRERQLQDAGLRIPQSLEAGHELLEKVRGQPGALEDYRTLQDAARMAATRAAGLAALADQAHLAAEHAKAAVRAATQSGDPSAQVRDLEEKAAAQRMVVAAEEHKARTAAGSDVKWPANRLAVQAALEICAADRRTTEQSLEEQQRAAARLTSEAEEDITKAEKALGAAAELASALRASDPAQQLASAQQEWAKLAAAYERCQAEVQPLLTRLGLSSLDRATLEAERGRAEERVRAIERQLADRPTLDAELHRRGAALTSALVTVRAKIGGVVKAASELEIPMPQSLLGDSQSADESHRDESSLSVVLVQVRQAIESALSTLNEAGARVTLEDVLQENATIAQTLREMQRAIQSTRHEIDTILVERHLPQPASYTLRDVAEVWPLVTAVSPMDITQVTQELELMRKRRYAAEEQARRLAVDLQHSGILLNVEQCEQRVAELTEEREICFQAMELIQEARDRIARRVLPTTERNMQLLLPQLTSGRYRDVRLTAPEGNDGQLGEVDYRIRVWDPAAGRYVSKNLFSGGTRDQCSLALRLAFALATLPQELGIAPGFIFLDEPLSAFDAQRAHALVDLLTAGTIAKQFDQVVVISHHHTFDRNAFQYHVRMEAGHVLDSDLPNPHDSIGEFASTRATVGSVPDAG